MSQINNALESIELKMLGFWNFRFAYQCERHCW